MAMIKVMSFITQWFFIVVGLITTYWAARLPGFELHIASLAFVFFLLAFRADNQNMVKARAKKN